AGPSILEVDGAVDLLDDRLDDLVLAGEVVIDRWPPHAELGSEATHRQALHALVVDDPKRRRHDQVARQQRCGRPRHRKRAPRQAPDWNCENPVCQSAWPGTVSGHSWIDAGPISDSVSTVF